MNVNRPHRLLCQGIRYHDYLAALIKIDAEWSQHRQAKGPTNARSFFECQQAFTKTCHHYADGIQDNFGKFWDANHPGQPRSGELEGPAPWLYQPMFFVPFGHADVLAVCLLDDFEPLPHLVHELKTTIEDLNLAFCPALDSLALNGVKPLCEFPDLFFGSPRPRIAKSVPVQSPDYASQAQMPLAAFTQYKLDGLASMGQTLLLQQALLQVMGRRVHNVTEGIARDHKVDPDVQRLFPDPRDVEEVRVVLLDLQGPEEIGTFILCRNFSIAMACVESLRSITYGEVLDADETLKELLRRSQVWDRVLQVYRHECRSPGPSGPATEALRDNHIFRWTHTMLGVSSRTFFEGAHDGRCSGFVEALTQFQTAPGHRDAVEGRLERAARTKRAAFGGSANYRRFLVGTSDVLLVQGDLGTGLPLNATASVVEVMRNNLSTFGVVDPRPNSVQVHPDSGRDVIDMTTQLVVPIPTKAFAPDDVDKRRNLLGGSIGDRHFGALLEVLKHLQPRLCLPNPASGTKLPENAGRLSMERLVEGLRSSGVPVALRRLVQNLYQNFTIFIADPFLFDSVLDLYDALATYHAVIADHLPDLRARELGPGEHGFPLLDTCRLEQLADYAEALCDAMRHRLAKAYLESPVRDVAIDFHGGLNQLLLAADAPLKCGLGLVRRFARATESHHTVGGLTRIAFMPGARCCHLALGTEDKANLAYLEVDVPHVLHAPSYIDYLHEAFHLVLDALLHTKKDREDVVRMLLDPKTDRLLADRLSEVFAFLMCRLFVFGRGADEKAFVQAHLAAFARSCVDASVEIMPSVVQTSELLLRLFLAYDSWAETPFPARTPSLDVFERFLALASPILRDGQELWAGIKSLGGKYCWTLVQGAYRELNEWTPWLRREAFDIYYAFYRTLDGQPDPYDADLYQEIGAAIADGRPLTTCLLPHVAELDPLVLICRILQFHLGKITNAEGRAVYLRRKSRTFEIDYSLPPGQQWHEFQIDRGMNAMFCPVPEARRRRLRNHIAMLKSFWNIAALVRSRRLHTVLSDNWSDAELSEPAPQ